MDGAQGLDSEGAQAATLGFGQATAQSGMDSLFPPARRHREIVNHGQDAQGDAGSNHDATGCGWLRFPSLGHGAYGVHYGFMNLGGGTEREPGILFQKQSVDRERLTPGRRECDARSPPRSAIDQAQATPPSWVLRIGSCHPYDYLVGWRCCTIQPRRESVRYPSPSLTTPRGTVKLRR